MYSISGSKSMPKFLVVFVAAYAFSCTSFAVENDKESVFKVIKPRELTPEEKLMKFNERFNKHYIGGVPSGLEHIVKYIKKHDYFSKTNLQVSNTIFLYGNPGSGKKYLPETLAQQLQIPLISVSADTLQNKNCAEISKNVQDLINFAKIQNKPTIFVIDKVDGIKDDKNEVNKSAISALLIALQKIEDNKNVFVFVTANDINILDTALKDRLLTCEIKDFSLEQRTQLIMKKFKENESPVEEAFAKRFAEVISKKGFEVEFKPFIEPGSPIIKYITHKVSPFRYYISNQDIERIISTTVMAQKIDCKENPGSCKKPICYYVRAAFDKLGFSDIDYAEEPIYCCGI